MKVKISINNYREIMKKLADKDFIEHLISDSIPLATGPISNKMAYRHAAKELGYELSISSDAVASYGCNAKILIKNMDFIINSIPDDVYCLNVCPFTTICNKYLKHYENLLIVAAIRKSQNKPYDQLVDSMVEYATKAAAANPDKMKAKRFFEFV